MLINPTDGIFEKPFDATSVKNAIYKCLLNPSTKWNKSYSEEPNPQIKKFAKSLKDLEDRSEVMFGRGGFFVSNISTPFVAGNTISFHIETSESERTIC